MTFGDKKAICSYENISMKLLKRFWIDITCRFIVVFFGGFNKKAELCGNKL